MTKETLDVVVRALKTELKVKNCGKLRIVKCPYRLAGRKQPIAFSRILRDGSLSIIEVFRKGNSLFWRKPISVSNERKKAKKIAIEFLKAKGIQEQDIIYHPEYLPKD